MKTEATHHIKEIHHSSDLLPKSLSFKLGTRPPPPPSASTVSDIWGMTWKSWILTLVKNLVLYRTCLKTGEFRKLWFASPANSNPGFGSAPMQRAQHSEYKGEVWTPRIPENWKWKPSSTANKKNIEKTECPGRSLLPTLKPEAAGQRTAVPGAHGVVAMWDVSSINLYQYGTIKSLPAQ